MEPVELAQEPKTKLRHGRTALRLLSFPVLLVYLELVLRLYMGLRPDYLPVVLPFALSGGSLLAGLTAVFPGGGTGSYSACWRCCCAWFTPGSCWPSRSCRPITH